MFGINPSEYKESLMPKRKLYIDIEPIRIERIEPIKVYTIRHVGEYEKLDETWEQIMKFAAKNRLFSDDFYAYAIAYDNPDISNNNRLRYDACVSALKEVKLKTEEVRSKILEAGKYAVFLHKGKHTNLTHTYDAIFGNWLYKSSITLRDIPVFQRFLNDKREVKEEELLTEVWVPLG